MIEGVWVFDSQRPGHAERISTKTTNVKIQELTPIVQELTPIVLYYCMQQLTAIENLV